MQDNNSNNGISKFQAIFRGHRSRDTHVKRAKEGSPIVCPYAQSSNDVIKKMLLLAKCKKDDIVVDLGSGDGSILINVALQFGSLCYGYDIDNVLNATAKKKSIDLGISHLINIIENDILCVDVSKFDVIFMFLVPSCLEYLSLNNLQTCKKGTRIVCYKFPLPESWKSYLKETIETEDVINPNNTSYVYLYIYT